MTVGARSKAETDDGAPVVARSDGQQLAQTGADSLGQTPPDPLDDYRLTIKAGVDTQPLVTPVNADSLLRVAAPGNDLPVLSTREHEKLQGFPDLNVAHPGDTVRETIKIGDEEREYFLHVPKGYKPGEPRPILLVFNGYGAGEGQGGALPGGAGMADVTGLNAIADRENFTVVYMNGNKDKSNSWNNGQWFFSKQDDIGYVRGVLDKMQTDLNVDPSRVYFAGFSQGASFMHRAASELGDRVAAIADVSGWMTGKEQANKHGYSVLSIQSKDDDVVKADGKWMGPFMNMMPENYTDSFYRQANGILGAPAQRVVRAANGTDIVVSTATNPQTGTEVSSILVEKEGHVWFGGLGLENKSSINASETVWSFLSRHAKRDVSASR